MKHIIKYGSEEIEYTLIFRERKTLGITVHSDRTTVVNAPLGSSMEKVEAKVRKRAAWILKQHDHFLSFEPRNTARNYVSGESHLYLGRQYQLLVEENHSEKVTLSGGHLKIYTKDKSRAKKLLEEWYMEKAKTWFENIAAPVVERFKKYQVAPEYLEIRKMQYRWGSCSAKGRILLNPELIKAPRACIEYVIIHELCHLVHRDHTTAFFDLQQREFPEWKKWKEKLENTLA